MGFLAALIPAAAGIIGGILSNKGQNDAAEAKRQALINALKTQFGMAEDKRTALAQVGGSAFGGIDPNAAAYGGRIHGLEAPSPDLLKFLQTRRATPNFSNVVADPNAGSTSSMLGSLLTNLGGGKGPLSSLVKPQAPPATLTSDPAIGTGVGVGPGIVPSGGSGSAVSMDDLNKLIDSSGGGAAAAGFGGDF